MLRHIRNGFARLLIPVAFVFSVCLVGCGGKAREDVQNAVDDFTGKSAIEQGERLKADLLKADSLQKSRRKEFQDKE